MAETQQHLQLLMNLFLSAIEMPGAQNLRLKSPATRTTTLWLGPKITNAKQVNPRLFTFGIEMPATKTKKVVPDREIVSQFCRLLRCYGFTKIVLDYDYNDDGDGGVDTVSFSTVSPRIWSDNEQFMASWTFDREFLKNDKRFIPEKKYLEFKSAVERLIPPSDSDRGCYGDIAIDIERDQIKITHNKRFIREETQTVVI